MECQFIIKVIFMTCLLLYMPDVTHIRIASDTAKSLKKIKEYKRETYDEVILRLIDFYNNHKKEE